MFSNLRAVKTLAKTSAVLNNQDVFKKGYDCGKNGSNTENCHFSLFSTPERTKAWEEGKKAGELARGV